MELKISFQSSQTQQNTMHPVQVVGGAVKEPKAALETQKEWGSVIATHPTAGA